MRSCENCPQHKGLIDQWAHALIDALVSELSNAHRIHRPSEILNFSLLGFNYKGQIDLEIGSLSPIEQEIIKQMEHDPNYQPKILMIADIDGAQFDPTLYGQILAFNPDTRVAVWSGNPLNNLRRAKIFEKIQEFIPSKPVNNRTFFEASLLKFLAQPSEELIQMALTADFLIWIGSTIVDVVNLDRFYERGLDPKRVKLFYVGNHMLR